MFTIAPQRFCAKLRNCNHNQDFYCRKCLLGVECLIATVTTLENPISPYGQRVPVRDSRCYAIANMTVGEFKNSIFSPLLESLTTYETLFVAYAPSILDLAEARGKHSSAVVNRISNLLPEYRLVQGDKLRTNTGGYMLFHTFVLCAKNTVV